MASTPRQYSDTTGKAYNHFLPAKDKDSLMLHTNYRGKCCTEVDHCVDCHNWSDKEWEMVNVYHKKLAI